MLTSDFWTPPSPLEADVLDGCPANQSPSAPSLARILGPQYLSRALNVKSVLGRVGEGGASTFSLEQEENKRF